MKKVLALVLAVLMVATVAMAADIVPGKTIKILRNTSDNTATVKDSGAVVVTIATEARFFKDINSENYSVTSIKYNEGKAYIESIKINDSEDRVEFKVKQDYTLTKEKSFDVDFTLKGKGKITLKDKTMTDAYNTMMGYTGSNASKAKEIDDRVTLPAVDVNIAGTVGYKLAEIKLDGTDSDVSLSDMVPATGFQDVTVENALIKFVKDGAAYAPLNTDIGENGEVTLEVRVYDGNKVYLNCSTDPITSVLKANADSDAEMYFYDFEGTPTFDATAKLYFNDADETYHVYQVKNGKLVKAGSYSEDDGCWVVKARTLGQYVVSDMKLASAASTTDAADENPDTGANDVVGIATAIAAVALVSAAAVSLKK